MGVSRTSLRIGKVIADSCLLAALFAALPAAVTDKSLAGLIFLVPVSVFVGAVVGVAIALIATRRRTDVPYTIGVLLPAAALSLIGFIVGSLVDRPELPYWHSILTIYGAFVGAGAGLGATTAANRGHAEATPTDSRG